MAVLADEQHVVVVVEREDRDRARMAADVTRRRAAIGAPDRVDAERQVATRVEDLRFDELFAQLVVRVPGAGPRIGQAAAIWRSAFSAMPLSGSKR